VGVYVWFVFGRRVTSCKQFVAYLRDKAPGRIGSISIHIYLYIYLGLISRCFGGCLRLYVPLFFFGRRVTSYKQFVACLRDKAPRRIGSISISINIYIDLRLTSRRLLWESTCVCLFLFLAGASPLTSSLWHIATRPSTDRIYYKYTHIYIYISTLGLSRCFGVCLRVYFPFVFLQARHLLQAVCGTSRQGPQQIGSTISTHISIYIYIHFGFITLFLVCVYVCISFLFFCRRVTSYKQFVAYLRDKAPGRIGVATLPFEGGK